MQRTAKFRTVLFDLDGTLMDTSMGIFHAIDYTCTELGLREMTLAEKRTCIGPPMYLSFARIFGLNEADAGRSGDIFRAYYAEHTLFEAEVYPGIRGLLERLRENGIKTGVATLKRDDSARRLIDHVGLSDLFDIVLGTDPRGATPKEKVIQDCLDRLNVQNASSAMVGDTQGDIDAALKCKIAPIGVSYGFGLKDGAEGVYATARDAAELEDILLK